MRKRTNSEHGFSLIEALVVVSIALVLFAIALPSFLQAYRSYQLTNAAEQVSGVLKATRSAAIRLNAQVPVNCVIRGAAGQTRIWSDSNIPVNDGIEQGSEPQIALSGNVNLVQPGIVPNAGGLAAAVGVPAIVATSPVNGVDTFDGRGASNPAAVGVYVLYVGNTALPALGYRAVVLMPSGSIQIWSADNAGNWHKLS